MIHPSYAKIDPIKIRANPSTYCHRVLLLILNKCKVVLLIHFSPPNSDKPATPEVLPFAYSGNSDPDRPGTPVINFCQGFFDRRSLTDAITFGKALVSLHNLKLASYDNRARILLVSWTKSPRSMNLVY